MIKKKKSLKNFCDFDRLSAKILEDLKKISLGYMGG